MGQRESGAMFLGIVTSDGKIGPTTWIPPWHKSERRSLPGHSTPAGKALDRPQLCTRHVGVATGWRLQPYRQQHPEYVAPGGVGFLDQGGVATIKPGLCITRLCHLGCHGTRDMKTHCARCANNGGSGRQYLAQPERQLCEEVYALIPASFESCGGAKGRSNRNVM